MGQTPSLCMRGEEFELEADAPGILVPYGRRPYYRPDPLPPARGLAFDDDFYELLSEATFWLGKLSGVTDRVDFSTVLYTSLLRKEALESTEIEGANADYNALHRFETRHAVGEPTTGSVGETKDVREVLNYEQAIEDGVHALDADREVTADLIHDLHRTLLTGVPDDRVDTDTIGAYKTVPNHLGNFLPPVPGAVEGLMDALVTYYRTGGSHHPLVDIALFHYQFETIHPYGDGNGRLGRLLITLQLYDRGYLERPNLYLSEYFNRNKRAYVERMEAVRRAGEWEAWVEFVVRGIRRQAEEAVVRTRELATVQAEYEATYGESTVTAARLACSLFEQPYVTVATVAERFDVERSTAHRAIHALIEDGILEEVASPGRSKDYRAREIFDILEQPPQTY